MDSCWNRIGTRGDGSCPELKKHIHCRNCPVHAAGAIALLERPADDEYLATWTAHVAAAPPADERSAESIVIFRVDAEWLALPTPVVEEVMRALPVHSVPHRRRDIVLGVANVRGKLTACVSLGRILGVDPSAASGLHPQRSDRQRFLVIGGDGVRAVCPVDEVYGVQHIRERDLREVPATLAKAATKYSRMLLSWQDRSVGIIDAATLLGSLKRSLA